MKIINKTNEKKQKIFVIIKIRFIFAIAKISEDKKS